MDLYSLVKIIHIISATIVFGTGLGMAYFMLMGQRSRDFVERRFAARVTVLTDYTFTLPAVIVQPLSGAWLVWKGGFDWTDFWLVGTYALYVIAGLGSLGSIARTRREQSSRTTWLPFPTVRMPMTAMRRP